MVPIFNRKKHRTDSVSYFLKASKRPEGLLKASKMFANSQNTAALLETFCLNIPDHLTNTNAECFNIPVSSLNRDERCREAQGRTAESRGGLECVGSCASPARPFLQS